MTAPAAVVDPGLSRAQALRLLTQGFVAAKIETPALDARLLVCAALGIGHLDLLREPDRQIGAAAGEIEAAARRRLAGEPVARIIGRREFYGLDFALTPAVLDPRPDTEILVEATLGALEARRAESLQLLDLGVGSGAILAGLLSHLPAAFGVGVDRSEPACRVARSNLAALGFADRSAVVCADWASPLRGAFDAIVSNPPYIATGEIAGLAAEVRAHDPHGALDGGADGLAAYRILAAAVPQLLRPDGIVALEVGATQAESVGDLLSTTGALKPRDLLRDLGGHVRVVTAVRLVR